MLIVVLYHLRHVRSQLQCVTHAAGDVVAKPWHSAKLCYCMSVFAVLFLSVCLFIFWLLFVVTFVCLLRIFYEMYLKVPVLDSLTSNLRY